ncbi:MAG TPA: hypothetical protein VGL51_20295 [Solirubrobacteraceae bacterium]
MTTIGGAIARSPGWRHVAASHREPALGANGDVSVPESEAAGCEVALRLLCLGQADMFGFVIRARAGVVGLTACLVGVAGFSTLSVTVAEADVFAAVEVQPPGGRTDFDVEVVNASTGGQVPLPGGVNTPADELHPSISGDGSRLVLERRDSAAGTVRIIAADLHTGQSSDLFTGVEASQDPPTAPSITPDGQTVVTGGAFAPVNTAFEANLTTTSLAPFPAGPYPHGTVNSQFAFPDNGQVADVAAASGGVYALQAVSGIAHRLIVRDPGEPLLGSQTVTSSFDDPALAASNPQFVLFARRSSTPVSPFSAQGDIEFLPVTFSGIGGTPTRLPGVVNTSLDESQPAVTADGRFIAFVRHGADGHDRLVLWDSETQLLVNPSGVDLGAISSRGGGSVSLFTQPVFSIGQVTISQVSEVALVNVETRLGSGLGILVQRIVGRRRILGRREYRLRMVGRVPLGRFRKGRHHLRWNLRVDGKRLRRGRYLVTLRALSRRGVIRDLATPNVIRIR